ncbi:unnamed protein product [Rotaria sp. Silwood1]|nr:unnamed protein product [Rotaria sp. Silwood1]
MDILGLGSKVDVDFILDPQGQRKQIDVKIDDTKRSLQYIYYDGEDVNGTVQLKLKKNNKVEHQGIRLEFIGQIEMLNDRSTVHEFLSLSKLLAFPGELSESTSIDFSFPNVEKPYESYIGINIKLRYFLRLTIIKRFSNNVFERDICVQQLSQYPEINNSIKMEVGIEDCLHIEFEYNKSKYHLKDVIVGKIYFLLVRIKIKHMEIAIIKKENTGTGPNIYAENETIAKYEIMDGAPVREKSIKWNYLREIKLDSTYGHMAANNQQIFLGWKNRIVIYNIDGTKYDETRLQSVETYGELCDLIYSSTMECFFILCRKSLFIHYPTSHQVEILSYITLINHNNHYISITTNKNKLFLLNEKSLDVWRLNNKIFLLDYSILITSIIKNQFDENICCIRTTEQNLAVLIQNHKTHTWRLDLFNIYPFQCIYMGTSFDYFNQPNLGLFIPLNNKIYLFMNWETKLMRMIDSNGLNQIIDYNAFNACLLGTEHKIIVNYMTHLKVYEF